MRKNQYYKNAALSALSGNWAEAVLAATGFVLVSLFVSAATSVPGALLKNNLVTYIMAGVSVVLGIALLQPLKFGLQNSFRQLVVASDNDMLGGTFRFPFHGYLRIVGCCAVYFAVVIAGFALLIVPGIILALSYAMVPYILADEPELKPCEVLKKSREIMKGHKMDLFLLELSFIGWVILGLLTLGVGCLWLEPYMDTAKAAFYKDLDIK